MGPPKYPSQLEIPISQLERLSQLFEIHRTTYKDGITAAWRLKLNPTYLCKVFSQVLIHVLIHCITKSTLV